MSVYYVAALGPTHAHDPYICFRCPMDGDRVCWPLPWAGTWSEADVMEAAAKLNNGVDTVAVPENAVRALATAPVPGKIDGDVGPVVRNSALNRRALVVAGRQNIARLEAFAIPRVADPAHGKEAVLKALGALLPLLCREENVGNDRLWRLRADLLLSLHVEERQRDPRPVQAVNAVVGHAEVPCAATKTPQRPIHPTREPGQAEVAVLRIAPPPQPQPTPSPDTMVKAGVSRPDR